MTSEELWVVLYEKGKIMRDCQLIGAMRDANSNGVFDHEGTLKTAKGMMSEKFFARIDGPDFSSGIVCF